MNMEARSVPAARADGIQQDLREAIVEIDSGKLRGHAADGVYVFKGVPYGADTRGEHRFLAPRPVKPWTGVRDALQFGPRAPQNERPSKLPHLAWIRDTRDWSEDCLVLNVYTPSPDTSVSRPVMVYIHGGGYISGAGSAPGIEGSNLARSGDVVVVTINHRLNLFGHLYLGHLDSRYADSGNVGMLDIVSALQWVRRNIQSFGGDPANVTIFGQSGGASKVAVLMHMPSAQGLFHKAIIQSASSLLRLATREAAERNTHYFLAHLGCAEDRVAGLLEMSAERLLQAMPAAVTAAGQIDNYRPLIDDRNILANPFASTAAPMGADIPLVIGWCETELRFTYSLTPDVYAMTQLQACERVARLLGISGDDAEALLALYREGRPTDTPGDLFALIHSDHQYRCSVTRAAELKAAQRGAPVYMYEFTWRTPVLDGLLRTPHTMCIPFAFGNCDIAAGMTGTGADRYPLEQAVMGAWVAFARSGDPNHPALPQWQPFDSDRRATMIFDTPCSLVNDPASHERVAMAAQPDYEPDALFRR